MNKHYFYKALANKGYFKLNGFEYLRHVNPNVFQKLGEEFPVGVLTKPADELDYDVEKNGAPYDLRHLRELGTQIERMLNHLDVGVVLDFHFLGFAVNPDIHPWHNDKGSKFAGQNMTVNCYYDDTNETIGGGLHMRRKGSSEFTGIFPKKFDIIAFNQTADWEHRVSPSNHLRRVISFAAMSSYEWALTNYEPL